uniref:Uncharacterized protein n=1 Tax=Timema poppense TaxID=170557 RepID=A0A7R9HF62_TIMPO|nr:unnamed protein product [Timema poppensis]
MTHKQRVEEFNRHLDSLTEHFDIPKVSWTKAMLNTRVVLSISPYGPLFLYELLSGIQVKVQTLRYAEFLDLPQSLEDSSRNPK